MSEAALLPGFYWHTKEHSSWVLPEVQYTALWVFPTERFRYISCWPGYAWFSASGIWAMQNGTVQCVGRSQGFSDDMSGTHTDRVYSASYTVNEEGKQLVPDEAYKATLTRIRSGVVESLLSGLDEKDLPHHWRDFQALMWKIERYLGITRKTIGTFLKEHDLI